MKLRQKRHCRTGCAWRRCPGAGGVGSEREGRRARIRVWYILGYLLAAVMLTTEGLGQGTTLPAKDQSQVVTVEGRVEISLAGSAQWKAARPGQLLSIGDKLRTEKQSRATVRLSDLSDLRINELTLIELLPPQPNSRKPMLDLKSGSLYFLSREKPADIQFRTPTAAGAIRGTELVVEVSTNGETHVALLEGEVELSNPAGWLVLKSGEEARVAQGRAPRKTALIDAVNVIQWCLYYPAVLDPDEIHFTAEEQKALENSLAAYRAGDLLQALAALPAPAPASQAAQIYQAALQLSVGQVGRARELLGPAVAADPLAQALEKMIAAVQFKRWEGTNAPVLASEWLAESYYQQSRADLKQALKAARMAVARSPGFGFGWVRVAELEFSFGRLAKAQAALATGLKSAPRHAPGLALKGFLAAANNQVGEAIRWFDRAIEVDGALANAWLGRGLCRIRRGDIEAGRADLQVAATLEPQRAVLRSYLAKAFSAAGQDALAAKELRVAKQLDPGDPTAWLYSALLNQQHNRINEAIRDLEESQRLNDNQAVFRSRLLLDQDRAVRGANLASIYRDAGMQDVSLREAAKAVNSDYANYSAHLFLGNSYDYLRDPKLYNLRFETPAKSEWLIGNLLAPVSSSSLSRQLSQQDYVRLLERDRLGLISSTEYFSSGEWIQSASQYGLYRNVGYALDVFYHTDPGQRANNDLEQLQLSVQGKAELTPQDSVWLQGEYFKQETGDIIQYYDQKSYNPTLRVKETQEPNVFLGYHHQWMPGVHTLFLAGRLDDTLEQSAEDIERAFFKFGRGTGNGVTSILPRPFDMEFKRDFEAYSVELQQIWQSHAHTVYAGTRYQAGWADASSVLTQVPPGPGLEFPAIRTAAETEMDRFNVYGYYQWQVWEPLRLTAGVSYDRLHFPRNADIAPVSAAETTKDLLAPKFGLLWTPWSNATVRAAYSRSLGGFLQENSVRLEPTQIAGFNQAFRSLIPESAEGLTSGAEFETRAIGIDQRLPSGTYLGVEGEWLTSDVDRWVGAVSSTRPFVEPDLPFSTRQKFDFEEHSVLFTANQLISDEWSVGARYRISEADLRGRFPELPSSVANFTRLKLNQDEDATIHQVSLFLTFNHPSGFYGQFQSVWTAQSNHGYDLTRPGDHFWQEHFFVGYRFPKRIVEIRLGILNLSDEDYRLNPLNLYAELPRERTFVAAVKFNF